MSSVLNIVLDLFCIIILKWGCGGAAIATVISQALSGIACLILILRRFEVLHVRKADRVWIKSRAAELLTMGVPMGLQFSITAIGSMVMQSANNSLGLTYVSAFTASNRLKQLAMSPFDGIANGTSVFCSQNMGAGENERSVKGLRTGVALGVSYGFLVGLGLIFGGRALASLFVGGQESLVLDAAARLLRCLGSCFWMLGILNICRMSAQGLGYSGRVVFAGFMEMAARTLVSFLLVPILGFTAICWADQSAWVAAIAYVLPLTIWCVRQVSSRSV